MSAIDHFNIEALYLGSTEAEPSQVMEISLVFIVQWILVDVMQVGIVLQEQD